MSIHVCKCTHKGEVEYHLRYPGMSEAAAQEVADKINAGLLTQSAEQARDAQRYLSAINWALGADEFPERQKGQGAYWWRTELAKRAGLQWNGTEFTAIAKEG